MFYHVEMARFEPRPTWASNEHSHYFPNSPNMGGLGIDSPYNVYIGYNYFSDEVTWYAC